MTSLQKGAINQIVQFLEGRGFYNVDVEVFEVDYTKDIQVSFEQTREGTFWYQGYNVFIGARGGIYQMRDTKNGEYRRQYCKYYDIVPCA